MECLQLLILVLFVASKDSTIQECLNMRFMPLTDGDMR